MSTLIALIAIGCVVLWSIIATVELISRDGYGQVPVDPDRLQRLRSS